MKSALCAAILILSVSISSAQPGGGGGDPDDEDEGIPIDGGVSYLAAAGIAYGAKKMYDKRNRKEENK